MNLGHIGNNDIVLALGIIGWIYFPPIKYCTLVLRDAVQKKTGYFMTLCKKVGSRVVIKYMMSKLLTYTIR